MLNIIIENLEKLDNVKFNKIYREETLAEATKMFEAGWDKLEDGIVILTKGNLVAVKEGRSLVKYECTDFRVNKGNLIAGNKKTIETKEIKEELLEKHLAQAIITKFYTLPRA